MHPIEWRQKAGLTQQELSKKLDIGLRSLARYEAGGAAWPFAVLVRLKQVSRGAVAYEDVLERRAGRPRRSSRRHHRAA